MNPRLLLSFIGLGVIAFSFYLIFEVQQYADYALYILLGWMVVNFVLLYAVRPRGPPRPTTVTSDTSPFPSTSSGSTPLASGGGNAGSIAFCIYCANPIAPGTRACPSCGHALPQW